MSTYTISNDNTLNSFNQIDVQIDPEYGIVWVYQNPHPCPCFNPELIAEVRKIQLLL